MKGDYNEKLVFVVQHKMAFYSLNYKLFSYIQGNDEKFFYSDHDVRLNETLMFGHFVRFSGSGREIFGTRSFNCIDIDYIEERKKERKKIAYIYKTHPKSNTAPLM